MTPLPRRLAGSAFAFAAAFVFVLLPAAPAPAEDAVILNDGYTLRGILSREKLPDFNGKISLKITLDVMLTGPKGIFFSSHAKKQLAAIEKGVEKPKLAVYTRKIAMRGNKAPPAYGELIPSDWKGDWTRTMKVQQGPGQYTIIDQLITHLGPDAMYVASASHAFGQSYDTRELRPVEVRKLLATHPELKDPAGEVDPLRRLKIATFMRDTGWYPDARAELSRLKAEAKAPWAKEATERYDQLVAELDTAETKKTIEDIEAAVNAGRYKFATARLKGYEPKSSDAKDLTKLAELRATVDKLGPQFDTTVRLLQDLLDRTTGRMTVTARAAAVGGFGVPSSTLPQLAGDTATLVTAATAVLAELHPDTAARLEAFRGSAETHEKQVKGGQEPGTKPLELLALAVSGWMTGKNGALPDPAKAVKMWNTRATALAYLRERVGNQRTVLLNRYLASNDKLMPAQMAQIVSLLPPVLPEPLDKPTGVPTRVAEAPTLTGVTLRNTGPLPESTSGLDYFLRLPDEYQHGRSYPVMVALTDPLMPPEVMLASLADMANKYGYILVAPKWTLGFTPPYDYSGGYHPTVLGVMRDVARRFNVDADRVFLFGVGNGGTLALDLGLAHPDLFAGLTLFGPTPDKQVFNAAYWTNAQKLPIFTVTGDRSGGSIEAMRILNENWLPNGYPSLLTVYRGRGAEWFSAEVPNAFDWMNRKSRVRGVASLRLNDKRFDPWKSMRASDNRFYWIGFDELQARCEFRTPDQPHKAPQDPAQCYADIRGNKIIAKNVFGMKTLVLWLERDMINWDNPVEFDIDNAAGGTKKRVLEPDLKVMFEELYRTGDRKMLFFGKIEIPIVPR